MATVDEAVKKYVELRDRIAEISKRHEEEMKPYSEAMQTIETWLLSQMNTIGVDSFKTAHGTAYKTNQNSVKLTDAGAFKGHVFAPALANIRYYLGAVGYSIQDADVEAIKSILETKAEWAMVEFRVGKKGVLEHLEATNELPPGVSLDTFTKVGVRRA